MIEQISIFTENAKGAVQKLTALLAKEQIDITGFVTNDSAEYGIIRMLVSDPRRAQMCLEEAGYLCRKNNVTGVVIRDSCGGLDELLRAIRESNVNVAYIYVTFRRETGEPVAIFSSDSILETEQMLSCRGFCVL